MSRDYNKVERYNVDALMNVSDAAIVISVSNNLRSNDERGCRCGRVGCCRNSSNLFTKPRTRTTDYYPAAKGLKPDTAPMQDGSAHDSQSQKFRVQLLMQQGRNVSTSITEAHHYTLPLWC